MWEGGETFPGFDKGMRSLSVNTWTHRGHGTFPAQMTGPRGQEGLFQEGLVLNRDLEGLKMSELNDVVYDIALPV